MRAALAIVVGLCATSLAPASAQEPAASDPLAGFSDGTPFLRSPDNFFLLFPSGRLQVDSLFFKSDNKTPNNTFLVRRARIEMAGWISRLFFFNLAGDFAASAPAAASPITPSQLITTDDYLAIAPWQNWAILQLGQFDAPFTLENRTSDKYFDFIERSMAVRAFGIPSNKEQGLMLHGILPKSIAYYSLGVFNGRGQDLRNDGNGFDVMGRVWLAIFPPSMEAVAATTVGGSFWRGQRTIGLPLATQTTAAGFAFWLPRWTSTTNTLELHQEGTLQAVAVELNVPVAHKLGVRVEFIHKNQPYAVVDVAKPTVALGKGALQGWATYIEGWYWLVGDDRIIGAPGLQLPTRFKEFGSKPAQRGLMLAARIDVLHENTNDDSATAGMALGSPVTGTTRVTAFTGGANYWWSKRLRASVNYGFNRFAGNTKMIKALPNFNEHELLVRLATCF